MTRILTVALAFLFLTNSFLATAVSEGSVDSKNEIERFYPEGNGFFALYYGGWIDKKSKRPSPETLDAMRRLWKSQPNFVVVANEFKGSSEIVEIFHKTDADHQKVRVLSYVMMTDEPCKKLRSKKDIDANTQLAMTTGYDGMFFDCAKDDPNKYEKIHEWNADRVKEAKKTGDKLVIMNPGEALVDSRMFDYADIVSVENQYDVKPTAFVRTTGIAPADSERMEVAAWRWLAVQGHPSNKAAHNSAEAIERLKVFRQKGGFWYYSPSYKTGGDELSTHTEIPDWLEDFSINTKLLGDCSCKKSLVTQNTAVKVVASEAIYHGAFPEFGEAEDIVTASAIQTFEDLTGKNIAWAYFSNNWFVETDNGKMWPAIRFPREAVLTIWSHRKQIASSHSSESCLEVPGRRIRPILLTR